MVKVTEADREAAAKFLCDPFLVILARHRIQARREALEEAAKASEIQYAGLGWHPAATNAGIGIAETLRNLSNEVE